MTIQGAQAVELTELLLTQLRSLGPSRVLCLSIQLHKTSPNFDDFGSDSEYVIAIVASVVSSVRARS